MKTIKLSEVKKDDKIMFNEGFGAYTNQIYIANSNAKTTKTGRVKPMHFKDEAGNFCHGTGNSAVIDFEVKVC